MALSEMAKSLWAKTSPQQSLWEHMQTSAHTAKKLWREWLSCGVMGCFETVSKDPKLIEQLFVFLAAAHDLGKATPVFQLNPRIPEAIRERVILAGCTPAKCPIPDEVRHQAKHALATHCILTGMGIDVSVAVVLGGHHGKPPSEQEVRACRRSSLQNAFGFDQTTWTSVQQKLFTDALTLSDLSESTLKETRLTIPQQMLLNGMVILSDWISSSIQKVSLPTRWTQRESACLKESFANQFGFPPNLLQQTSMTIGKQMTHPGIFIIEAPMGCGKTEAALALAELFAAQASRTGVYFALPSRATADGIFERYLRWVQAVSGEAPHAMVLAHGKAAQNQHYHALPNMNIQNTDDVTPPLVYIHDWLSGRKLQLLSDFALGTIDQLLMGALRHKFLSLRHLGLANKVVIIDEVHAYDAYMDSYLCRMLTWLGQYGVPVIVLSATLPVAIRKKLLLAYQANRPPDSQVDAGAASQDYPLLTYTDKTGMHQQAISLPDVSPKTISIKRFDGEIGGELDALLAEGGCACVIVNTVKRSQEIAAQLSERFGSETVFLLHAKFLALDRSAREQHLLEQVGKQGVRPHKWIVVGTQVVEQSLDIDFDVLFTDCCPMDLLLQRVGRLHRHHQQNPRPTRLAIPTCYVLQTEWIDEGAKAVYGAYPLLCTRYLLPEQLVLPDDIAPLVHQAYGDAVPVPETEQADFDQAKQEHRKKISEQETRAEVFQLASPIGSKPNLLGWLDYSANATDVEAEASVRDSSFAIEVLLLQRKEENLHLLPWVGNGERLPTDQLLPSEHARLLSCCSITLPYYFSLPFRMNRTLATLEQQKKSSISTLWEQSHWLRGMLYLILDEQLETELCGKRLAYDRNFGLMERGQ